MFKYYYYIKNKNLKLKYIKYIKKIYKKVYKKIY